MQTVRRLVDFHDAFLLGIECSWEARSVTIRAKWDSEPEMRLVGRGLRELSLTQHDAWSPSVFLNRTEISHHPPDLEQLLIEMPARRAIGGFTEHLISTHGLRQPRAGEHEVAPFWAAETWPASSGAEQHRAAVPTPERKR